MTREELETLIDTGEAYYDSEQYCYWVDGVPYNSSGTQLRMPTGEDYGDGKW